jgi:Proteasome-substrate-size regulator, mid region
MKRELVKSLRTVALLAMFSQDSTTVSNIQSALKSMSIMEPDLILHPILERAVPSLEGLNEVCNVLKVCFYLSFNILYRRGGQLQLSKPWEQLRRQLFPEKFITQEQNFLYLSFSCSSQASILYV